MISKAVAFAAGLGLACLVSAQSFPSKPIKIIAGFGAGGTADSVARLYAQKMSELLNTPVIVENRPGAQQLLAIRTLMSSPPDGHTLNLAVASGLYQNPALTKDLPYDPLKDFSLIGIAVYFPGVIFASPELPFRTVQQLVDYAKANPGKLNYGSAGDRTAGHLAIELLMSVTGTQMTHIPFKSDADVIREVMTNRVQVGIMTTLNTTAAINAGNIRGLAVTTAKRLPFLPNVPSLPETGLGTSAELDPHTLAAFVGPAGMPAPIVARLNETINKISAMNEVADRVRNVLYGEPASTTPASFRSFVEKQLTIWAEVGKSMKPSDK